MKKVILVSRSIKILFSLILILTSGCSYKYYYPMDFEMKVNSVTAADLEEDGYLLSTGQDEIEVHYTLASLDRYDNLSENPKSLHYGPHTFSYRGETQSGYAPLSVSVPAKGKIYFSIHLIENDDYYSIQSVLEDAETIVDIAKFVSRNKEKGKLPARSLRLASRTLNWLGIAITIIDVFDTNDKLMGFCTILDENQLATISNKGSVTSKLRGTGSNWGDRYDYSVNFTLLAKEIFGETIREKIKSKAPNFYVNASPLMLDQNLNKYWSRTRDKLLEESPDNKDTYQFSDGLFNKNFATSLGFCISPALRMGYKNYGKFYFEGTYRRLPYSLNFDNDFRISPSYFSNSSNSPANSHVNNLELDLNQYSGAIVFKLLSNKLVWDIGGGVLYHRGKTNFQGLQIENSSARFIYDENLNVLEKSFMPFAKSKLGIGKINKHKGYAINLGIMAFNANYKTNDNFKIYSDNGNNFEVIPLEADNIRFNFSFGVDVFF